MEKIKTYYEKNRKPILIILAVAIVGFLIYRSASNSSKNNLTPATLSFESSSDTLSSDSSITIKADTKENRVGFVQVKVAFDPSKISLKQEVTPNPTFKTIVKNTSVDEANANGEITVALGLEPGNTGQTGSFDIGTITFELKTQDD